MNAKTVDKMTRKAHMEVNAIVKELEVALSQVKYHNDRLQRSVELDDMADCLDSINRQVRMMKSHINETALAYIAGQFDAWAEEE